MTHIYELIVKAAFTTTLLRTEEEKMTNYPPGTQPDNSGLVV